MGMTDPIADMLTRVRNGQGARKTAVEMPASRIKLRIAEILAEEGYVKGVETFASEPNRQNIRIFLKYHQGIPVIERIKRESKPGCRRYVGKEAIPKVFQGLGMAILSTNRGVISSRKAQALGVGGELICTVF